MKYKNKQRLSIIKDYIIGWTLAFIFLCIVRGVGTIEMGSAQFEFWPSVLVAILLGSIFGSISGYAQILMEKRIYRRVAIQKLLALRSFYAFLFLTAIILVSYVICKIFLGVTVGLVEFAFEPGSFAIYFYILVVDSFMVVVRQVKLFLGGNNLGKLLSGKFYKPREEERIFMFLDLQSSTQLAEKLGHIQYSRLIQDCFNDVGIVIENEAEVYQYVGDEVILTWEMREGLSNQNCIAAYFNFKQQLTKRQHYYFQKYQCRPFFKAGMNAGMVTVSEIGKYKKEIAYHGDTLNTAARIQAKCNDFKQELLISENLFTKLKHDTNGFRFDEMDSIALRGKAQEVLIYAVTEIG